MATAKQNGYVYIYVTNEIVRFAHTFKNNKQVHGQSGLGIWFDDLIVTNRTGPLLQACPDERGKAHFYPFGQEITPLSSKALLKIPNDRMLQ